VNDSRKPLDHWLAPEGAGKPLACLATSFTFEADFFEQQCLGRFLGLDWKRDEGDNLAFLIEQEERLAETRVSVVVDRASATEGRSLRWDLLPVGVRGGVMHAKVCLLVWERLVRGIVGSANLTPAGYRRQLEAQIVLDASAGAGLPKIVIVDLIDALRELVGRAPGSADEPGPKQRALATLEDAQRRLASFGERRRRNTQHLGVISGAPGRAALDGFDRIWRGGPPRSATVLSPFFDAAGETSPAVGALVQRLASRGPAQARFVVAAEQLESRVRIQAPSSLLRSLPGRVDGRLHELRVPDEPEPRLLHAKAIVLESDQHVAAMIGSSNFTAAGLGLSPHANLEINVAIGAPRDSEAGQALLRLIPAGDRVELDEVEWAPEPPEEEQREPELPWGFQQALLEPVPTPTMRLRLAPPLPPTWSVRDHTGKHLTDDGAWEEAGRPRELRVALPGETLPFFLRVTWTTEDGELRATWPVNVTDMATLPPPDELRHLPVDALLRALASTRPLHESLSQALRTTAGGRTDDELDPLRRFSETGQLLRRAKEVSLALAGLRERLERPAATEDALAWRLGGPFGPVAIANGLIEQARRGGAVPGETSFLLAELALTLARVDWQRSGRLLPGGTRTARRHARQALHELRALHEDVPEEPHLAAYVERAYAEASL
jgi:phosphatidylserine/phosphatidylglycerophosphate/cardiolipin synthase-like enzyme